MGLYKPTTGVASSTAFANTMAALDLATQTVLGAGVISGLTVDNTGALQPGRALIGHVVTITAATPLLPLCHASSTNYVYLSPGTGTPNADGTDPGQLTVNQTGTAPASAVLLAEVVTGAGSPPAFTSANNAPAGRVQLALPIALNQWTGAYNPAAAYEPGQEVSYEGSSYICTAATTGNAPPNTAYWGLLAAQGQTGAQGESAFNFRGLYNSASAYAVNEVVAYNGSSYVCTAAAPVGTPPPSATYWQLLASVGAAGETGSEGPAGPSVFTFLGSYSAETAYVVNNVVTDGGSSYVCTAATTGNEPPNTAYWQLLASVGAAGTAGSAGAAGAAGAPGSQGPAGINWRAAYASGTTYNPGDAVTEAGSVYICIAATTGNAPPNATYWGVLVAAPKRRVQMAFPAPSDAGVDFTTPILVPAGTGGASSTWAATSVTLVCGVPNATATTVLQVYAGSDPTAGGSGTDLLQSAATCSGTGTGAGITYENASLEPGITFATGAFLVVDWNSLGCASAILFVEIEEQ